MMSSPRPPRPRGAVPALAAAPRVAATPYAPHGDGNGARDGGDGRAPGGASTPLGDVIGATGNRLLAALSSADRAWLAPQLERVTLAVGDVLAPAGEPFTHVYFPETAVASVVSRMADGGGVEVGTVGNEGMVGVAAFLEAEPTEGETFIQVPGVALRAAAAVVTEAAGAPPGLRRLLGRYTHAYLTQVAQGAACNRLHHLEARCARWLLMTHDRVGGADAFPLKQEFLALMLGVRRPGVTVAAGALQDAGLIRYRRASIRVLDRPGLEAASCECYGIVRRHFDRLLP